MFRTIALTGFAALVAAATISFAPPVHAQIGNIFSDPARARPVAFRAQSTAATAARRRRGSAGTAARPPASDPQPSVAAGAGCAGAGKRAVAAAGAAAGYHRRPAEHAARRSDSPSQPNQGVAVAPSGANPPPAAPGQRQQPKNVPQTPATLQPRDEVVSEPPAQKIVNKKASFSGLDKITGRIINFDEDVGETVQFGALRVKTDACYTRPATEAANTDAFVEVDEITLQGEVKRIFSGWMYAASPGLHGVEHPIYDIWLTDCKAPDATVVSVQPDPPKPAPLRWPRNVRWPRRSSRRSAHHRRRNSSSSPNRCRRLSRNPRRSNPAACSEFSGSNTSGLTTGRGAECCCVRDYSRSAMIASARSPLMG